VEDDPDNVIVYQGEQYPTDCTIENCRAQATTGGSQAVGIEGEGAGNLIISNKSDSNDTNYGTAVQFVYLGQEGSPSILANISLS